MKSATKIILASVTAIVMAGAITFVSLWNTDHINTASGSTDSSTISSSSQPISSLASSSETSTSSVTISPSSQESSSNASSASSSNKSSSKSSSSKKTNSSSRVSTSSNNSSSNSSSNNKKDWFDISKLTGTQADVGKVVGYSTVTGKDIVVTSVVEGTTADGRKFIKTTYSFGPGTTIIECEYCHKFPCPADGRKNCPKYDPLKDPLITCERCGRPRGDGYNGTCLGLINWNDPTKPFVTCNYYD